MTAHAISLAGYQAKITVPSLICFNCMSVWSGSIIKIFQFLECSNSRKQEAEFKVEPPDVIKPIMTMLVKEIVFCFYFHSGQHWFMWIRS